MTYSFVQIGDVLYNKLLEIETEGYIGNIYNYDVKIEDGINMPAIIIAPSDGNETILSTCKNNFVSNFVVRVVDRMQDDLSAVEANIRRLADMVKQKVKSIKSITRTEANGEIMKIELSWDFGFADTEQPLRVFELNVTFTGLEDVGNLL